MRQSIINKLNSNNMSNKKVIEPVIIEQSDGSKIEITPYGSDFLLVIQEERPINILNDNRTTVAKAICPEYQKAIDHNKFLEFENARLTKMYQKAVNKTHEVNDQNAKLVEALEEAKKDMEWMWENLSKPHTSDHFNIPSNAINAIEQIKVVKYFGKGEKEPTVIDNPSARELTTVAKAICPEYQKVIDQNAKLVEALEKVKDMQENRQKLFNHMSTEHGLTLLESEMNSIYSICIGHEEYVKYLNWLHSKPVDTKTVDAVDPTFWRRLEMFVSNIQVNDMAGEEEKQYIIHVIESKK